MDEQAEFRLAPPRHAGASCSCGVSLGGAGGLLGTDEDGVQQHQGCGGEQGGSHFKGV